MEKITTVAGLKKAIQIQEDEQAVKGQLLKDQLFVTYESFKPGKLIGLTLKEMVTSPNLIENVIDTGVALATGYLSRKIVVGASSNVLRKILGSMIQVGAAKFVNNHSDTIKSIGQLAFQQIFRRKKINPDKV